ncbi:hypothetical protein EV360DRAFT_52612, partial [Lentinula raphanica]
ILTHYALVKKYKGRTPASSDHPSRPSFDRDRDNALYRDGYKCVVTGRYDHSDPDMTEEKSEIGGGAVHTRLAHIVPDSTYFTLDDTKKVLLTPFNLSIADHLCQKKYAASVLAVLQRFGYDVEKINGDKVHSLHNVMTLEMNTHDWFDCLGIFFEKTVSCCSSIIWRLGTQNTVNCYQVLALDKTIKRRPTTAIFTTPDPVLYPVPDPELLTLHATCAKVAYLSGAGEYLDKIHHDEETIGVLATDGGSFEVLNHALLQSFIRVGA